jgi:hypothetical protein
MIKSWIAKIIAMFSGNLMQKIIKCLPQIVAEVEKAMVDGKIDAIERKQIAMATVDIVAKQFNMTLNSITKWIISCLIDQIAMKLPSKDIKIPDIIVKITKEW